MALALWLASATAALACPTSLPETEIELAGRTITIEVADEDAERSCGLMYREEMAADRGMLFAFEDARPRTFWMKNTLLPLSIAFMREDGTIVSIHQMTPSQTSETYSSAGPAKYALEMNQGWFVIHGIKPGMKIDLGQTLG